MEESVSTNKMLRTEVEMRDLISHMPDEVLLRILSFLPFKEVVATSLLSKRWNPLWRSVPTLDLNRLHFQRLKFFHRFVRKMLKFADLKSVKKFVLRLGHYEKHEYFRPSKISKLINAMMCNNVEHLELNIWPSKGDYELPSSIFAAKNMKVLKLSGVRNHWSFKSGVMIGALSYVNLPLLEVLDLDAIKFSDFKSFGMLLSACALLKHTVLKYLYGNINGSLDIGGFKHLVTADVPQYLLALNVFSNVTSLRIHSPWQHNLSPCPDFLPFLNLTRLEHERGLRDWETIFKYLHSCPKLEILMISQFMCGESLEPTVDVPHCVSSNLKEFHLGYYEGNIGEFELARFIMKNAMVLGTISITKDRWSSTTWKNQNLKRISKCLISSMNCKLLLK